MRRLAVVLSLALFAVCAVSHSAMNSREILSDGFIGTGGNFECRAKLDDADFKLVIAITANKNEAQVKLSSKRRSVKFSNVNGVRDANGNIVFTDQGFALHVTQNPSKPREFEGTYIGAVGLGAWITHELKRVDDVICEHRVDAAN